MKRLTERYEENGVQIKDAGQYPPLVGETLVCHRLADIEDILGDEYNLDRLRELVEADREGRCVVFQHGYDVVSIYNPADEDGLYTMSATGVITKEEYEAALRREQDD